VGRFLDLMVLGTYLESVDMHRNRNDDFRPGLHRLTLLLSRGQRLATGEHGVHAGAVATNAGRSIARSGLVSLPLGAFVLEPDRRNKLIVNYLSVNS
jgi:hypothetical protein